MPNLHSTVAYPFTKSLRHRDKIMSEVMLSRLHKALVRNENYVIITQNGNIPSEILIKGYYFKLDPDFATNSSAFYIYVEADREESSNENAKEFPELLQTMGSPIYADHECIFDHKLSASELEDLGISSTGDGLFIGDVPVIEYGGYWRDDGSHEVVFINIDSLYRVYYFGETFDNTKRGQIWVRTRRNGQYTEVINPYVYCEGLSPDQFGFGQWAPLGAVYKDDIHT